MCYKALCSKGAHWNADKECRSGSWTSLEAQSSNCNKQEVRVLLLCWGSICCSFASLGLSMVTPLLPAS